MFRIAKNRKVKYNLKENLTEVNVLIGKKTVKGQLGERGKEKSWHRQTNTDQCWKEENEH